MPESPEELLSHLDPEQLAVATHLRGPIVVRAGAGTGKTRAITYRIAYGVLTGVYHPNQVLAVTFTSRAAGEMRSRLRDLGVGGVQAQTFHAAALRQLSYFWEHGVGGPFPRIQESKLPLVAQAAGSLGLDVDQAALRDLASEVEWSKVTLVTPEDYPARARAAGRVDVAGFSPEVISRLIVGYEEAKSSCGVIDFEDIILILSGLLIERADITAQIRHQYRVFVVDEYQDVSPLQQRLLELWLGERRDLCVVGDVSQTIYTFTGATPRFLSDFQKKWKDAEVVELVRDYRSTPQVVDAANKIIAPSRHSAAVELEAQRPSGQPVAFVEYSHDASEADGIAERIIELRDRGTPLSEMAILFRTNNQSQAFETALSKAGIGYSVRGGVGFFKRAEVKEATLALKSLARSGTSAPVGEAAREVARRFGWSAEAPTTAGAVRERWESLDALVSLADELARARSASVAEFVAELEEREQMQNVPSIEGVTLSSLHAAKGLEWDAVFLAGVSEGLLPISLAETPTAIEEERRLLYVGVTRAREYLQISFAKARTSSARASRKRSRFLDGIWPEPEKQVSRSTSTRRRAKETVADFEANHAEDIPLFEELKAWRRAEAIERGKPAYVILHDTSLIDIAIRKPRTIRELASMRGIGSTKLDTYGAAIVSVVDGWMARSAR